MRPTIDTASAVPALASRLGRAMLATYFDRTGDGVTQVCVGGVAEPIPGVYTKVRKAPVTCSGTLLWGRLFGETGAAGGSFDKYGPGYHYDLGGLQVGADIYHTNYDILGLYGTAATLQSSVDGSDGTKAGNVSMNAYGVGGYWTHRDPAGWYTDLVVQANKFDSINVTPVTGLGFGTDGWGLTVSAEAGYTFQLGGGYSITPQGQFIYQRTSINGVTMASTGQLTYGATDELYGRLGGRLAKNWLTNDNRVVTTWFDANFWHQFGDNPTTQILAANPAMNQTIPSNLGGTWAQLGLGVAGRVSPNLSMFGSVDYDIGLDRPEHALGGRAGMKVTW